LKAKNVVTKAFLSQKYHVRAKQLYEPLLQQNIASGS